MEEVISGWLELWGGAGLCPQPVCLQVPVYRGRNCGVCAVCSAIVIIVMFEEAQMHPSEKKKRWDTSASFAFLRQPPSFRLTPTPNLPVSGELGSYSYLPQVLQRPVGCLAWNDTWQDAL